MVAEITKLQYQKLEHQYYIQMQGSGRKLPKYLPTQKGAIIRVIQTKQKKVSEQQRQNQYLNRRVITQTSQKGVSQQIKKLKKQNKFPFRSVSPKVNANLYLQNNNRHSCSCLKKIMKIKSPTKSKGLTQTGPLIKKKVTKDKSSIFTDFKEDKKTKLYNKIKSPTNKTNNNKDGKIKKQFNPTRKTNLKTEGSFDSTSSCLFNNQITIIGLIGQGTFGQVFKARLKGTGEIVAIKRVLQDKKYNNRQFEIVTRLKSNFIMNVLGTYMNSQGGKQYLNIIMSYYDCDLFCFIKQHEKKAINSFDIKLISYQVFRGLLYIHSQGICHRDIKPQNILLKGKNAVICDFGSAKVLRKGESNLPYICSRCYRAPQLIFGNVNYTTMIDIWSMGCVLIEMLNEIPLFIGQSSIDHLIQVMKVMGTPTKTQVVDMNPEYDLNDYKFPKFKKKQWTSIFPNAEPLLIDLLNQIMLYSPEHRLTAAQALSHEYYDQLREKQNYKKIVKITGIQKFFHLSEQQLAGNEHLMPKLIPAWYIF